MSDPFLDALDAQAGPQAPVALPRAARNNNPGNLRWDGKSQWHGMTGVDPQGFVQFDSPESGHRALSINLGNQDKLHGLNTVRGIISKYAPPTDGNDTDSYIATVASGLGVGPDDKIDPADPRVNQALQGSITPVEGGGGMQPSAQPPQAANDPFLAALDHATQSGNAGQFPLPGPDLSGNGGGPPVAAPNGSGDQNGSGGFGSTLKSVGSGLAASNPITDSIFNGRNYFQSWKDNTAGIYAGASKVPQTALDLAAYLTRHVDGKAADAIQKGADWFDKDHNILGQDKGSSAYGWGNLEGEIGATLPVAELTPLAGAAKAAKVGKFLSGAARYGDMALQGGAAGAALSQGKDVGTKAAEGALLAPVVGAAAEKLLPLGIKAAGAVSDKAKAIAAKLAGGAADEAPAVEQSIAKASDLPIGNIEVTHTGTPFPADVAPVVPKSATPADIQQALGSRGARTGIESTTQFPADTAAHIDQLRTQGVPLEQAIREADITAVGGSPTAADVTRNPALMTAVKEGAKSTSTEGQALSLQASGNNAALHQTTQDMVHGYGGAPAPGDAMQGAAESLKKSSDTAYKGVSDAYDAARQAEGDQSARPDQIREVLNSKEAKALVAGGGPEGQLITTVGKLVDLYTDNGAKGLSPDEFNSITKIANQKYDPMGGGVNHWVGQINKAVDDGLDSFDKAGPAYRAARAKMRDYASQYRDPKGVSGLIRSDASGSLVGDNTWRSAENMIGSKNDKPFIEIADQLKANSDTESLNRLKASIVQSAYESATGRSAGTAADQSGNSIFSGSKFHARLNDIGMNKLKAVFSDQEIAKLAQIGRAGVAVNEAVPGTVNTSHTASAIMNSLKGLEGKKAGVLGKTISGVMHGAAPVLGAALHGTEGAGLGAAADAIRTGVSYAADAAGKRRAAAKLAEALRTSGSPATTRAREAAINAKKIGDALRKRAARKASSHLAPVAAALSQGNR